MLENHTFCDAIPVPAQEDGLHCQLLKASILGLQCQSSRINGDLVLRSCCSFALICGSFVMAESGMGITSILGPILSLK